jgi:predicted transposase YbfD/YdcC
MHIIFSVFQDSISTIEDPRQERKVRHRLDELLWLMFCAVLCGAESGDEIEEYGLRKLPLLRRYYPYRYGIASASTIERLLRLLNPVALRDVLPAVMQSLVPTLAGKLIAIDGKTSRGSKDNQFKALHHLSAFVADARLVIAHQATEEKSNEITAIPALLDLIDITGSVVSMDAMGTQRSIAQKIIDKAADYFMGLKGNQGTLQRDVEIIFGQMMANPSRHAINHYEHTDKGHGRIEERICTVSHDVQRIQALHDWPGLQAIVRVESIRDIQGKIERETRWYLSSQKADAKTMLSHSRGHWSIENSLHYVLDVTFHEDAARHRKDHAAENMALLRKLTLNFIQTAKSTKDSVKKFRKRLGWDDDLLYSLITGNS